VQHPDNGRAQLIGSTFVAPNSVPNTLYTAQTNDKGDRWSFEVTKAENGFIIRATFVPDKLNVGHTVSTKFFVVPDDGELNVGQHIQAIMISKKLEG